MAKRTIAEIIKEGSENLYSAGIAEARREAGILMEYVLGISREKLLAELNNEVSLELEEQYFKLIHRRKERYPLQYIIGEQEFMGLSFKVNPNVLIPRRETEELVEYFLGSNVSTREKIVDVGTGSGAIAISIKKFKPDLEVIATEFNYETLQVARLNAHRLRCEINFLLGDLLKPLISKKIKVNYIISNPPYVTGEELKCLMPEVKHEPIAALYGGKDGLKYYKKIASQSSLVLYRGGKIFLELGTRQAPSVYKILLRTGFKDIEVNKDYQGRERFVSAVYGG